MTWSEHKIASAIARLANLRMWDAYRRADIIQAERRRDTTLPA